MKQQTNKTIKIPTTSGEMDVPVFYEEGCNNLCVTMTHFGMFEITHINTGKKIYGDFERAVTAVCEMIRIELSLIEIGIIGNEGEDEIKDLINSSRLKITRLGDRNVLDYLKLCSCLSKITNEFPWENKEDSPFTLLDSLRKEIKSYSLNKIIDKD